jgi:predicted nucleic acid-binding protein
LLLLAGEHHEVFITDAEVFQELLHRYISLRNWSEGREVFRTFNVLMQGRIEAVLGTDIELAADLTDIYSGQEARDLVHFAIMQRLGIDRIVSADRAFDRIPDVERLDPAQFSEWRDSVVV